MGRYENELTNEIQVLPLAAMLAALLMLDARGPIIEPVPQLLLRREKCNETGFKPLWKQGGFSVALNPLRSAPIFEI